MPSRRALLAASNAALAGLAGCSSSDRPTDTGTDVPTGSPSPSDSPDGARPTQTPRDPRPLAVSGAWPQPGYGPGHAGVGPATGVPEAGAAYWRLRRLRSGPPLLADGRLFHFGLAGPGGSEPPTRTETPPTGTGHQPDGTLTLFCRDASDGRRLWHRQFPGRTRSATVADGHVLVAGDGFIGAYTPDGSEAWRRHLDARVASVTTAVPGTALVSTEIPRQDAREPDVRAYSVTEGTVRWSRPSPRWRAGLAAVDDTVYALSSEFQVGSTLTARALADGRTRWTVELDDNGIPEGPYAVADTVYVAPDDDGVHAFARSDGGRRWHYSAETSNVVGFAADADRAYLVDDGTFRVVDAVDGGKRYAVTPDGDRGYSGRPAVGSECVYLEKRGFPADLVALSRTDGNERWTYRLPETTVEGDMVTSGLAAQPVVADGGVYAFAWDGLYAFGPAAD